MQKEEKTIVICCSSSKSDQCGTFYVLVYTEDKDEKILEFDSIVLKKPCQDNPGLSLRITRNSNQVKPGLRQGSENPFQIIGIDSISVANIADNCSQDISVCNQTDLQVDKYLLKLYTVNTCFYHFVILIV